MKANQKFSTADEAVSPVIGVILMVAITVVLAAVVFVLVQDLAKGSQAAPTVSFSKDDTADRLTVVKAPVPTANWNQFIVRAQGFTNEICVAVNSAADSDLGGANCVPANDATATGGAVIAQAMAGGDYLHFCAATASGESDITITISHTATSTLVGTFLYSNIAECPTFA